jgi:hypothetical protein
MAAALPAPGNHRGCEGLTGLRPGRAPPRVTVLGDGAYINIDLIIPHAKPRTAPAEGRGGGQRRPPQSPRTRRRRLLLDKHLHTRPSATAASAATASAMPSRLSPACTTAASGRPRASPAPCANTSCGSQNRALEANTPTGSRYAAHTRSHTVPPDPAAACDLAEASVTLRQQPLQAGPQLIRHDPRRRPHTEPNAQLPPRSGPSSCHGSRKP